MKKLVRWFVYILAETPPPAYSPTDENQSPPSENNQQAMDTGTGTALEPSTLPHSVDRSKDSYVPYQVIA